MTAPALAPTRRAGENTPPKNPKFKETDVAIILETKSNIYKLKTNKNYDKRTKYEVYNDLKKVENNISVAAPPAALHLYEENKNIFPFLIDIL